MTYFGGHEEIQMGLLDIEPIPKKNEKIYSYAPGNEECCPIIMGMLKFLHDLEMKMQKGGKISNGEFSRPCIPFCN